MKQKVLLTLFLLLIIGVLVALYKFQTVSNVPNTSYTSAPIAVVDGSNQEIIIGEKSNQPTVVYTMAVGCAECSVLARNLNTVAGENRNMGVSFYGVDIQNTDTLCCERMDKHNN